MSDRIKFAVHLTPIETITDENSGSHDIIASEVGRSLGGGGDSLGLAAYNNTAASQGYLNATVNYSTASHSAGGTRLTTMASADFIFIKNTGYKFSDATSLGVSTTDVVIVAIETLAYDNGVQSGWYTDADSAVPHFFEIAWLQPGQGIVIPLGCVNKSVTQFGSAANDLSNLGSSSQNGISYIYVKTVTSTGSAASSGNAVEFLAVT